MFEQWKRHTLPEHSRYSSAFFPLFPKSDSGTVSGPSHISSDVIDTFAFGIRFPGIGAAAPIRSSLILLPETAPDGMPIAYGGHHDAFYRHFPKDVRRLPVPLAQISVSLTDPTNDLDTTGSPAAPRHILDIKKAVRQTRLHLTFRLPTGGALGRHINFFVGAPNLSGAGAPETYFDRFVPLGDRAAQPLPIVVPYHEELIRNIDGRFVYAAPK